MPGLTSLSTALQSLEDIRTNDAAVYPLDSGTDAYTSGVFRFQYFPETISDSKAVNWSPKEIPGASLPLYQWVSSGERTISFTAFFTTDVDFNQDSDLVARLKAAGAEDRNVDVRAAITCLRRFMLPTYQSDTQSGTTLVQAPQKLLLSLPNSGLGITGGTSGLTGPDSIYCIMTQCEVSWEAYFPSGMPRIATASLAFAQIAQVGGAVVFPAHDSNMDDVVNGNNTVAAFAYTLKPRGQGQG